MIIKKINFIIILILGIIISPTMTYGGINMFDQRPVERSKRVRKSSIVMKAEQAFLKDDYEGVVNIGNNYFTYTSKSNEELQHLMGRAFLKLKRFKEARNRFSRVINDSRSDRFLDEAYIGLADSYYLEEDYKKAKEYYKKVIQYFPDTDGMPIVYYRLGQCYSKLGNTELSKEYYDKLIRFYPYSLETRLLIDEKLDFVDYSVQVGSFRRWNNAKKLHDELKNKGYDVNIHTAILGDSRFYRVRVGRYSRLSDAEDMARILRNNGYTVKIYP
jgi:tetratricopeptide (TPR) repeat protein